MPLVITNVQANVKELPMLLLLLRREYSNVESEHIKTVFFFKNLQWFSKCFYGKTKDSKNTERKQLQNNIILPYLK